MPASPSPETAAGFTFLVTNRSKPQGSQPSERYRGESIGPSRLELVDAIVCRAGPGFSPRRTTVCRNPCRTDLARISDQAPDLLAHIQTVILSRQIFAPAVGLSIPFPKPRSPSSSPHPPTSPTPMISVTHTRNEVRPRQRELLTFLQALVIPCGVSSGLPLRCASLDEAQLNVSSISATS